MSIRAANYILNGSLGLSSEIGYRKNGFIAKFSEEVLDNAVKLLEKINKTGLLKSIEKKIFAGVKRTETGGKGADGVFEVDRSFYLNPFFDLMGSLI
jgi:beta-lysine 5,6-aminomutase alpha subunit